MIALQSSKVTGANTEVSGEGSVARKTEHIAALTGLRFIAAVLVYVSHFPVHTPAKHNWLHTFAYSGYSGVTLFFVLSGFVICLNYYDRFPRITGASLYRYIVARVARIYPMYLIAFLWFFSAGPIVNQIRTRGDVILLHLAMLQAWTPDLTKVFTFADVSWSVSVEVFLYLVFPFLVVLVLRRFRRLWQLAALGGVSWVALFSVAWWFSATNRLDFFGPVHFWLYQLPATRMVDFLLGCIAARIYTVRSSVAPSKTECALGGFAMVFAIGVSIALMGQDRAALIPFKFDVGFNLPFAVIIFCLARYPSPIRAILHLPILVLLGEASYSFYLLHKIPLYGLGLPRGEQPYVHDALVFAATCILSLGAYTFIERPLRSLVSRILLTLPQGRP